MRKNLINKVLICLHEPLYKNSLYIIANNITGAGAGFIFWLIAARLYSPKEVGFANAIISSMSLVAILSLLGFNFTLIRYLPSEKDKSDLINSCFTTSLVATLFFSVIYVAGTGLWSPELSVLKKPFYFSSFTILSAISTLLILQTDVYLAFRNGKFIFIQSVVSASKIIFLFILIFLKDLGIYFSYGIGSFLALLAGNILILKVYPLYKPTLTVKENIIKNTFCFSFVNYIATLIENLPNTVFPLLVTYILGAEKNAYFFIAWSVSGLFLLIPRAISLALFAEGSYDYKSVNFKIKKGLIFSLFLLLLMITGLIVFGKYVLYMFGERYVFYSFKLLVILLFSCIPFTLNSIFISLKRLKGENKYLLFILSFINLFPIIGGYYLMPKVDLIGIGISWLTSQLIASIPITFCLYKSLNADKKRECKMETNYYKK